MKKLGVNVPPGFTITTEACRLYYEVGKKINAEVKKQTDTALAALKRK